MFPCISPYRQVDLAVTTGIDKVTVGGETSYDTAKGALTKVR